MMVSIVPVSDVYENPSGELTIRKNTVGRISVLGGAFGRIAIGDPSIAKISPDALAVPDGQALVLLDPQSFKLFSADRSGETALTVSAFGATTTVPLAVRAFSQPVAFVPGVNHAHAPSGRWADVQANPNNAPGLYGTALEFACRLMSPQGLVSTAKSMVFSDKPIALKHLNWYVADGHGGEFVEDENIKDWLIRDEGIKNRLKREIFPRGPSGKKKGVGHFEFRQNEFMNQDFAYAFGAIDRVDFEVDFLQDAVRVWFQDRYEWHPVYPFYSFEAGDVVRETNCLHAALVELKSSGGADFWMKGQAEVDLSSISA